jgi:hypothetical protein
MIDHPKAFDYACAFLHLIGGFQPSRRRNRGAEVTDL